MDGRTAETSVWRGSGGGDLPGTVRCMPRPKPCRIAARVPLAVGRYRAHVGRGDCDYHPEWEGTHAGVPVHHGSTDRAANCFSQDGSDVKYSTATTASRR